MKYIFLIIIFQILIYDPLYSQEVQVIKFETLEKMMEPNAKKVKVFNFWATWCKPCIKEMPYFEGLHENHEQADVNLISFDFPDQLDSRLKPFVARKNIQSNVFLLDETDFNAFIDKIHPDWSGSLPATLMINGSDEIFFKEGAIEKTELISAFQKLAKPEVQP